MTVLKVNQNNAKPFGGLVDDLFNEFPFFGRNVNSFNSPAVNITETNDNYLLEVNAPGRNKEDFSINIDKNILTISFEKKTEQTNENEKQVRKEFTFESFKRSFTLDEKIATDAIAARYENGILKLALPKKEEVKVSPKQIEIK